MQARRAPQIARATADLAAVMRDEMIPNYLPPAGDRHGIADLCLTMALDLGAGVFDRQSRALRDRPDQRPTLAAFRGPALVLTGEYDRPCPRDRHDLMAALMPRARLAVIAGAGHIPPLDRPGETATELLHWLEA